MTGPQDQTAKWGVNLRRVRWAEKATREGKVKEKIGLWGTRDAGTIESTKGEKQGLAISYR